MKLDFLLGIFRQVCQVLKRTCIKVQEQVSKIGRVKHFSNFLSDIKRIIVAAVNWNRDFRQKIDSSNIMTYLVFYDHESFVAPNFFYGLLLL